MAVRLHRLNRSSDTADPAPPPEVGPYQLFILLLCVVVLIVLAVEAAVPLEPETRQILRRLDLVICFFFFFFFLDFLQSLRTAPNRTRYMLTWDWIDLLSSIPYVFVARWGRAARVHPRPRGGGHGPRARRAGDLPDRGRSLGRVGVTRAGLRYPRADPVRGAASPAPASS